jgi:hypothetical protein
MCEQGKSLTHRNPFTIFCNMIRTIMLVFSAQKKGYSLRGEQPSVGRRLRRRYNGRGERGKY